MEKSVEKGIYNHLPRNLQLKTTE